MADETRTLVGTWIEYLKNYTGAPPPTDKEFSLDFDRSLKSLLETTVAEVARVDNPETVAALLDGIRQRHPGLFARLEKCRSHYVTRHRMWSELADLKRQHSRAITIDHVKLFLSRLLYAVMIAAVVLATGYLAKLWDIPLPMLRGVVL
jgi:hypothetical protein